MIKDMKFCTLIELSKEYISFLYHRSDSDRGFVPFDSQPKSLPLAVYCKGNEIEVGEYALGQAKENSPYAFSHVFAKMRDGGTFKYRGQEIHDNMLLFHAIQRYLASFFDDTLIGEKGRLEQNVSTMPLYFLFHADVNENERLFVKSSFSQGGYANVEVGDYDWFAMRAVHTDAANYVCVIGNGENLLVNIYDHQGNRLEQLTFPHCGRDPRMKDAVDKLWESLGYFNYLLNRDEETRILVEVAEKFLASGERELNREVKLSSGHPYNVQLYLNELNATEHPDDGRVVDEVTGSLAKYHIQPSDCSVILQGKAAGNSYFFSMFNKRFDDVRSIDSELQSEIWAILLEDIKAANYQFAKRAATPSAEPNSSVQPVVQPEVTPGRVLASKRDERDLKILQKVVRTSLDNHNPERAEKDVEEFARQMHSKGVVDFDEELETLRRLIREGVPLPAKVLEETEAQPKPVRPGRSRKLVSRPKPVESIPALDKGVRLMRNGKFQDAREWFRSNGHPLAADDCTEIIKLFRRLNVYEKELEKNKETFAPEKARLRIKVIQNLVELYRKYGLDTVELTKLSDKFKRIR